MLALLPMVGIACVTSATAPPEGEDGLFGASELRVFRDPYAGVDWINDVPLLTQLHDHVGVSPSRIRAYDSTGYGALSLLDYSGVPYLPYAQRRRLWPPEELLPAGFLDSLTNLRVLLPGGEEVGFDHVVSVDLVTFIEAREASSLGPRSPSQYSDTQQALDVIRSGNGLAFMAHPWGDERRYGALTGFTGFEIYSAYAAVQQRAGNTVLVEGRVDPNEAMVRAWDRRLLRDPTSVGIAVNDHFGPDDTDLAPGDTLRDSGKIVVLVPRADLSSVRARLEEGAVLAVRDFARIKNALPFVRAIRADQDWISVDADGDVRWIVDGVIVSTDPVLRLSTLSEDARYARAEVELPTGTTVYTQAFALLPLSDLDGDGQVTSGDLAQCRTLVGAGVPSGPARYTCVTPAGRP